MEEALGDAHASPRRRAAVGSDMRHPVADSVAVDLERRGCAVIRCGAVGEDEQAPWPAVGEQVGRLVASGGAEIGIVLCWTGTGVSIAANKVPGVRAALCADAETARGARRWNDANVLALSLRATSQAVAAEIVAAWLDTPEPDRDEVATISAVEAIERRSHERFAARSAAADRED